MTLDGKLSFQDICPVSRMIVMPVGEVTCCMMGSDDLMAVVKEELGLGPGEVSADKKFSLVPVQCLGSCDTAPVVQVNEDYVEKLDPEKFRELIKKLKAGEK